MILIADTTGDAVDQAVETTYSLIVTRDRVPQVLDLVVAKVRISGDEQLQVHEVPTDLVNIYCIIIEVCYF